jgi:3-dehydroquinate synthase
MEQMLPEIHISGDTNKRLKSFLKESKYTKVLTLVDKNALGALFHSLDKSDLGKILPVVISEKNKNLEFCENIWNKFTNLKIDRKSLIILVGGGILGDLGGFCASSFKRGLDFVNIPTTLLAMTDSSIGGKQGINLQGLKNQIGTFSHPKLILIEPIFLKTLPEREIYNGYAEIIKHAAIRDREFFFDLSQNPDQILDWEPILKRSIEIKSKIVEEDPKEKGLRKLLNFGHTFSHGMESHFMKKNQPLGHGFCVAIGMLLESAIALNMGILEVEELKTFSHKILKNYKVPAMDRDDFFEIYEIMKHDKKNEGDKIQMTFMTMIGEATFNNEVSEVHYWKGVETFNSLQENFE